MTAGRTPKAKTQITKRLITTLKSVLVWFNQTWV